MSRVVADHERGEDADGVVDAAQVGVEDLLPVVGEQCVQRVFKAADSGVVDQDVETSEGAFDAGGGVFELMKNGDVAGDDFGFAAFVEDGSGGVVESGVGASAEDCGRAEMSEFAGDGGADAASSAGNQCDLAV